VSRVGAALELVDVARPPYEFESIVAANIWHRARVDVPETVSIARRLLAAVGERLEPGDRIIAGSILQVPVGAGDEIVVDLGELGRVGATIT
jgi:hypothetical protein